MLLLRTFGGLSLAGAPLPPAAGQPRRLALLVLLARGRDGACTRDVLMALLWPESPTDRARHALDQLLYATRRDLGRDVVLTESGRLRLNPDRISADCCALEAALEQRRLEDAVALYAGPFLDGVHFADALELEHWVERERSALAGAVAAALDVLGRDAAARGDAAAAVHWWRRRAELDPCHAATAVHLMEALEQSGDVAGALRHAQRYCTLLQDELGCPPDAAVTGLAERIARAPAAPAIVREGAVPPPAAPPTAGGVLPLSAPDISAAAPDRPPALSARSGLRRRPVALAGLMAAAAVAVIAWSSLEETALEPGTQASASSALLNGSARELYLRGRTEWNRRSRQGLENAVVLFRRATEQDPSSAEAFAGLAEAYVMLGYHGYLPADAAFAKGKAAADAAIALDPTRGDAYAALGVSLQGMRQWAEAEDAFRTAIRNAPEYATAHQWYALLLTILGRGDEAVAHGARAAELDPLSIQVSNTYGIMLYNAGRLDAAVQLYERLVAHEPDTAWVRENPWVLSNYAKVMSKAGRHEEAMTILRRALAALPHHPRLLRDLAVVYSDMGDHGRARHAYAAADPRHPQYQIYRALVHAELGDPDAAFAAFEEVQDWGLPSLISVSGAGSLQPLRDDPRYFPLRRRIGLPDEPATARGSTGS